MYIYIWQGFTHGSVIKNPPAKAEDTGLNSGPGRFPGEVNGNPLQYSCLGNPMDREDWKVIVYEVTRVDTV